MATGHAPVILVTSGPPLRVPASVSHLQPHRCTLNKDTEEGARPRPRFGVTSRGGEELVSIERKGFEDS
jgi:hypothetical protein